MAAISITTKVEGLKELETKLLAMGQELAAKNIVAAAYSANKVFEDAAKDNIAADGLIDTGLLQSSIKRKKIIYSKDQRIVIITGVSKNVSGVDRKGNKRVPWRYANILEPRYHFMQRAFDANKEKVVKSFVDSLLRRLKRYNKSI